MFFFWVESTSFFSKKFKNSSAKLCFPRSRNSVSTLPAWDKFAAKKKKKKRFFQVVVSIPQNNTKDGLKQVSSKESSHSHCDLVQ